MAQRVVAGAGGARDEEDDDEQRAGDHAADEEKGGPCRVQPCSRRLLPHQSSAIFTVTEREPENMGPQADVARPPAPSPVTLTLRDGEGTCPGLENKVAVITGAASGTCDSAGTFVQD
ncbi:hypothetical protein GCM10020219_030600 [Nonomuraea dietziae]